MSGMRRPVAVIIGMMGAGEDSCRQGSGADDESAVRRCGQ